MGSSGKSRKKAVKEGEEPGRRQSSAGAGASTSGGGGSLPTHLAQRRDRVQCDIEAPKNTESVQYGGAFATIGVDQAWTLEQFRRNFSVQVQSIRGSDMVFDLIGIDPAIANAFRRILISEVPTMAIEKVFIADNTSLIQDEVLAHRLGLVPLQIDPRNFEYLPVDGLANENNTVVFKLSHKCRKERGSGKVLGDRVLSSELTWMPGGSEYPPESQKKFTTFGQSQDSLPQLAENPPKPTYPDIVLAKLRPGQAMELEVHAVKGIGKTHAKWSPVATASYRMLPEVTLRQDVEGAEAEELKRLCPMRVFDIEDVGGVARATVVRPRDCSLCRECVRDEWAEKVQLTRVKNHFIFSVEGTGSLPPHILFQEAINVLKDKATKLIEELS